MDIPEVQFEIENYRRKHESEREWNLRRAFILSNKDQLKIDDLVTLASCYVNVKFYGCNYPPELMQRLSYYENNINSSLTESRPKVVPKRKLEAGGETWRPPPTRNKVNMHDSNKVQSLSSELEQLERKFKTLSTSLNGLMVSRQLDSGVNILQTAIDKNKMTSNVMFEDMPNGKIMCTLQIDCINLSEGEAANKRQAKAEAYKNAISKLRMHRLQITNSKTNPEVFVLVGSPISCVPVEPKRPKAEDSLIPDTAFILLAQQDVQHNATSILRRSAEFNKSRLEFDVEYLMQSNTYECRVSLEGKIVSIDEKDTREEAMSSAAEKALEILKKTCYTIISKSACDIKDAIQREQLISGGASTSSIQEPIPDSNIGNKLLKMMGWSGGGVGREGNQGIVNPISLISANNREGLGMQRENGIVPEFQSAVAQIVEDFLRNDQQDDLIFAPSFSLRERSIIHGFAQRLHLKTKSYNKGEERYLVLSRKRSPSELLTHLLNNDGETCRYLLIPPTK